jgi:hypothetical protein
MFSIVVGSTAQIIFGILVAVMYMKLYGYFAPMLEPQDDFLQELAQYQVFFTLFIALLLRTRKHRTRNSMIHRDMYSYK